MTPDEARDMLEGTTPGPWKWREGKDQNGEFVALSGPDGADALRTWDGDLYASGVHGTNADKALAAHAPDMAATIAGMKFEYAVEMYHEAAGAWIRCTDWIGVREIAEQRLSGDDRIVRRYVTEPEAADARWNLPSHRTEAGYPNCSTCDGGGCPDCTDPA